MRLPKYLKKLRERKGISQYSLGQSLGYSTGQFISNIERGIISLPPDKIKRCAEILKIEARQLLKIIVKDTIGKIYRKAGIKKENKRGKNVS